MTQYATLVSFSYESSYPAFFERSEILYTFPDKPLGQAKIYRRLKKMVDGVNYAPNKSLQKCMGLEVISELIEIVGQSHLCTSTYPTKLPNCWNNTITRGWKSLVTKSCCQLGYTTACPLIFSIYRPIVGKYGLKSFP